MGKVVLGHWTLRYYRLDPSVLPTGPFGITDWTIQYYRLDHPVLLTGPFGITLPTGPSQSRHFNPYGHPALIPPNHDGDHC